VDQLWVAILGQGSVSVTGANQDPCTHEFEPCPYLVPAEGFTAELTPTPAVGWTWAGWAGDPDCEDGLVTTPDVQCVARFAGPELVGFVSDMAAPWENWEIYSLDVQTGAQVRLSDHPAIDNHADISHFGQVAWSSDRGSGEFDILIADVWDVEGTARRLTFDEARRPFSPPHYADRHPHFHPDGTHILFTSKNRPHSITNVEIVSECSVPTLVPQAGRHCEGVNVLSLDTGGHWTVTELDIDDADPGGLWPDPEEDVCTYVGHPSFSHDGARMIFTGSASEEGGSAGTIWEVYSASIDMDADGGPRLLPASLVRHTDGPAVGPNPIQMSGGATWSRDDSEILFTSTRTLEGNSQLYAIPSTSVDVSVADLTPLDSHSGNDYVPHALHHDDRVLLVSDLGPLPLCAGESEAEHGATGDLDLVLLDPDSGVRQPLGYEPANELLLLGDEVSWFCGLSPNLSACRLMPRVMDTEAIWLQATQRELPRSLLERFGYPERSRRMYAEGWKNSSEWLSDEGISLAGLDADVAQLSATFPGLEDADALDDWLGETAELRATKRVMPSLMYEVGLSAPWPSCAGLEVALQELPVGPVLEGADLRVDAPHGWITLHFASTAELEELAMLDWAPYYEVIEQADGSRRLLVDRGMVRVDDSRLACDASKATATLLVSEYPVQADTRGPEGAPLESALATPGDDPQALQLAGGGLEHIETLDLWSIASFEVLGIVLD